MKVLVTGGAGFIGYHTIKELLAQGHEVGILDDLSTGSADNVIELDVTFFKGSITNVGDIEFALDQFAAEGVINLAAQVSVQKSIKEPGLSSEVNLLGFFNVLEACREHRLKLVYASSAAVYGSSGGNIPLNEFNSYTAPMSPYGADKLANDMYAQLYNRLYKMKNVGLRYFNVYGPKQNPASEYSGVISKFVRAGLASAPLTIFGDGEQTRNFVYVGDVAKINVAAITDQEGFRNHSGIVNVGSIGPAISINELVRVINKILPEPVTITRANPQVGDVRASDPDLGVLVGLLPQLKTVTLEDGLTELIKSL